MSAIDSLWHRFGNFFRSPHSDLGHLNGGPEPVRGHDQPATAALAEPVARHALLRWGRGEPRPRGGREGVQRVGEMMDALQRHFEQQDRRAAELTQSVERVAGILEQLAQTQHAQGQSLHALAAQSETAARHGSALSDTLGKLPASFAAQVEALRTVARQLEISQESDEHLIHSLQRFGHAADALHASSMSQVETLERLHVSEGDQKQALTALVREQGRRFLIVITIAAVLGVGALTAMGLTLALMLSR